MKTALITGANRGLGYGFVESFLEKGFLVFSGVKKIDSSLPVKDNLIWVEIDVTSDASIRAAHDVISGKVKTLDILVNNAGVNKNSATDGKKELVDRLESLDRSALLTMFNVNAVGPLLVSKSFLNLLNAKASFIVNISSCRASFHDEFEGSNGNYGYRASKVALNMMVWASRHDLPSNIKTFAVHPGNVKTNMNLNGTDDPKDQAAKIIGITEHWDDAFQGKFMRYDGNYYPL